MRWPIAHDKWNAVAFANGELADRRHVLAAQVDWRAQHHHVGPRDRAQRAVAELAHPRDARAVTEAQDQLGPHRHAAALADDNAHAVGIGAADWHEIKERDGSLVGLESRLEDQRVWTVAARGVFYFSTRRDLEAPVLGGAEQGRKAGIRIEARPAQPVDRAVRADECGAFAVPNECVVLDPRRNELAFPRHDLFRKPASTFPDHACANSITTLMSPGLRS